MAYQFVCMKKFVIVTGLRCHPPSEPLLKVTPLKKLRENKTSKSIKDWKKKDNCQPIQPPNST